jgi:hypothetical protein
MSNDANGLAPTSTATTTETEPEVVAGIASADLRPDQPLSIRTDRRRGYGRAAIMLVAGLIVGITAAFLLRGRG